MLNRVQCQELKKKIMHPKEAAEKIQSGMLVAFGGQVSVGCPKIIPLELSKRKTGEKIRVLSTSTNEYIDSLLANNDIVSWRAPMTDSRGLGNLINGGNTIYYEQQMNKMPALLENDSFGEIDFAVVEALYIKSDGSIVPTTSIGFEQIFLRKAKSIIIEVNCRQPIELDGIHDIYDWRLNQNKSVALKSLDEKLGHSSIQIDISKVAAVVLTDCNDFSLAFKESREEHKKIARNIISFLQKEMDEKMWKQLPPIQTGFGNLANEIINELADSDINEISFFCGHLQTANVKMLLSGKAISATCSSLQLTDDVKGEFIEKIDDLKKKLVIRNSDIINNSEVISRVAPITITSGIEVDIYGNVNLSHLLGSRVMNGLGGGANFAENAGLSIFAISSEAAEGNISTIVPMVSHQDICEHDIDVVITENGIADLRGKSDIERAQLIIENCAGSYKEQLRDYFDRARANLGHHPVILEEALSWHINFKNNKTMRNYHA